MIDISLFNFALVLVTIFLAGLIDSIAGGGGLISLPAYLFAGLPPHLALGTNKFSSCCGTVFATHRYFRRGMIDLKVAFPGALAALAGSWLGTRTVLLINPYFLNYILITLIPIIAAITYINKKTGSTDSSESISRASKLVWVLFAGFMIGFYDGFFGPGTGIFLILFFAFVLKYNYTTANGNTKVMNLASNIASVITFAFAAKVYYALAIPAAIAGILGNLTGSALVIDKGNKIIRSVSLLVMVLLLSKIIWNLIGN